MLKKGEGDTPKRSSESSGDETPAQLERVTLEEKETEILKLPQTKGRAKKAISSKRKNLSEVLNLGCSTYVDFRNFVVMLASHRRMNRCSMFCALKNVIVENRNCLQEFVVIPASPRKKMALTEHQKEKMQARKEMPYMEVAESQEPALHSMFAE